MYIIIARPSVHIFLEYILSAQKTVKTSFRSPISPKVWKLNVQFFQERQSLQ